MNNEINTDINRDWDVAGAVPGGGTGTASSLGLKDRQAASDSEFDLGTSRSMQGEFIVYEDGNRIHAEFELLVEDDYVVENSK